MKSVNSFLRLGIRVCADTDCCRLFVIPPLSFRSKGISTTATFPEGRSPRISRIPRIRPKNPISNPCHPCHPWSFSRKCRCSVRSRLERIWTIGGT